MAQDRQYGERVNVVKYVRVENKWRLVAVVEKNGRIIRDQVWIAGRQAPDADGRLDLGCVAAHGMFSCGEDGCYALAPQEKPATAFLFELIARLHALATAPMIDVRAYAKWLAK